MRVRTTGLPQSERYPCSIRQVQQLFGGLNVEWIGFGWPRRSFSFDSRCSHRPKLRGRVIAALTITRKRETHFTLSAVARGAYTDAAAEAFQMKILPRLRDWLVEQLAKPETAIVGQQSAIVECTGQEHLIHELR